MIKRHIFVLFVIFFFSACERTPLEDFNLSYVNIFQSTMEGKPTKWVRFKVTNTGLTTFRYTVMRVIDSDHNYNMYGGYSGYHSKGFHSNETTYGVRTKKTLNPGEEAYLCCNIGRLNNIKNARAFISLSPAKLPSNFDPAKNPDKQTITRTINFSIQ